jgi:hypothetical protein
MAARPQPPVHYLYNLAQSPQEKICALNAHGKVTGI